MGQKVNPHGLRVGIIRNWDSRWFARDDKFGDILVEDNKIRKFIKKEMYGAGIAKIEIERDNSGRIRIYVHCARTGLMTGKGGETIEKLRKSVEKMINHKVFITIYEVKRPDLNAQLVAEKIALDLEKRISFRRA
ncbi:MAG: 30S ribosomal protein S3, partial [Ruminococcaceae bacterium]|nr:30S ribosomal protein S3 [Oscillospiraceae bacterium]